MEYAEMRRKIVYISGTRADYGPARRLLRAIGGDGRFALRILVTGMHLDPAHGESWREIEADGFSIAAKILSSVEEDTPQGMCLEFGLMLKGISDCLADERPEIVLVLGDRGEALAGAMAGAYLGIVVCHLCGGSLSGSIDDSIRHATTKFSHYHFAASEEHAARIIQMGEDPARVFIVGLPGGDLSLDVRLSRSEIERLFALPAGKAYLLVVQHPVTYSYAETDTQIVETLEAVVRTGQPVLLGNPNDDAGGRMILSRYKEYSARYPQIKMLPPAVTRECFASLLAYAAALVGNSSQGIVEAMSVHTPVVNIGDRQHGREHLAHILCADYNRQEIYDAIVKALKDDDYRNGLFQFQSPLIRDAEKLIMNKLLEIDAHIARRPKDIFDRKGRNQQ
jgi:GDP/UDP-N,N'-diacetylbacillosamine 2-epimerase (hydrolysing)